MNRGGQRKKFKATISTQAGHVEEKPRSASGAKAKYPRGGNRDIQRPIEISSAIFSAKASRSQKSVNATYFPISKLSSFTYKQLPRVGPLVRMERLTRLQHANHSPQLYDLYYRPQPLDRQLCPFGSFPRHCIRNWHWP